MGGEGKGWRVRVKDGRRGEGWKERDGGMDGGREGGIEGGGRMQGCREGEGMEGREGVRVGVGWE